MLRHWALLPHHHDMAALVVKTGLRWQMSSVNLALIGHAGLQKSREELRERRTCSSHDRAGQQSRGLCVRHRPEIQLLH